MSDDLNRKQHWENVYEGKNPLEVSWYQGTPVNSLRLIQNTGIPHSAAMIDVGGGASLLVDHLLERGYENLSVLDISGSALQAAQKRLGEQASLVKWYEADVTTFAPPHPFTLWHDRAVFHFLTEPRDQEKYVRTLKAALPSGGHIVLAAFAIGGPEKCSGLDIVQYDAPGLLAVLGDDFELLETVQESHVTPANSIQEFSYFRLRRC